jgi:hypothetical protein
LPENATPPAAADDRRFFKWQLVAFLSVGVMLLLVWILWRRLDRIDPLGRCVAAYESARTATDSSLVDGIRVSAPDRRSRVTCGELRASGLLENVPRARRGPSLMPPPPQ